MYSQFLQFMFSGVTVGATYALAALGFTLIYNASNVINFAQGEFIMLGGMLTVFFLKTGLPMPAALVLAVVIPAVVGVLVEKLAIEPAKGAQVVGLIIITIGASLVLRGLIQIWLGKGAAAFPAFSGDVPIAVGGAALAPQSLWVLGTTAVFVTGLWLFFNRTLVGKAILATSVDPLAAQLVGINTQWVLLVSFALSAAIGAVVGSVTGYLNEDEKPLLGALAGALVGGGLALGGLMAWGTRRLIAAAAVGAVKHVNSTRDEQWLSRNPVAYG